MGSSHSAPRRRSSIRRLGGGGSNSSRRFSTTTGNHQNNRNTRRGSNTNNNPAAATAGTATSTSHGTGSRSRPNHSTSRVSVSSNSYNSSSSSITNTQQISISADGQDSNTNEDPDVSGSASSSTLSYSHFDSSTSSVHPSMSRASPLHPPILPSLREDGHGPATATATIASTVQQQQSDAVPSPSRTSNQNPNPISAEQRILERIREQQQQRQQEEHEEQQQNQHHQSNNYDEVEIPLSGGDGGNSGTGGGDDRNVRQQRHQNPNSDCGPPIYTPVELASSTTEGPQTQIGGGEEDKYRNLSNGTQSHNNNNNYGTSTESPGYVPYPGVRRSSSSSVGDYQTDEYYYYYVGGPDSDEQLVSTVNHLTPVTTAPVPDFFPQGSRHYEWMGRSLETLVLGYARGPAPILCLPVDEHEHDGSSVDDPTHSLWGAAMRRRSTVSTLGSGNDFGRRSSLESTGGRRGSLVGGGGGRMHGGTLANYYSRRRESADLSGRRDSNNSGSSPGTGRIFNRRGSTAGGVRRGSASHRRRMSVSRSNSSDSDEARRMGGPNRHQQGPNIALALVARQTTGKLTTKNVIPASTRLQSMSPALYKALDRPAGGMCAEVEFLSEVIDSGDWVETQTVISRIAPRLIGDPSTFMLGPNAERRVPIDDPNLPPNAPRYYAGGGRLGMERDAFVLADGIDVLIRVFRESSFVGSEMAKSFDARDLSEELVVNRLAQTWNEVLMCLRELVYSMPSLVEDEIIFGDGDFIPFLFTLLSHDSCFDGSASLLEEILSLQSHSPQPPPLQDEDGNDEETGTPLNGQSARSSTPSTFFLGNVPDLFSLWSGFNCRQLAHFCRILALLVFEPEDRSLLESPTVLKSVDLLQLRRNRAARSGRDSTVDMNQSMLLADNTLLERLLQLLSIMNYSPGVNDRGSSYHIMAQFPYIADTLIMLGLHEFDNWEDIYKVERLARACLVRLENNGSNDRRRLGDLGSVAGMLQNLSRSISNAGDQTNQLGLIIAVISAAQAAGVVVGRPRPFHSARTDQSNDDGVTNQGNGLTGFDGMASGGSLFGDGILMRRMYSGTGSSDEDTSDNDERGSRVASHPAGSNRSRITNPSDAANVLQFNALILGPYQVEVLFVLCTLLGGRRKIDAQETLMQMGLVGILDETFQRLPWDTLSPRRQVVKHQGQDNQNSGLDDAEQSHGIHGPGCECTPESALCVQYLRLVHNFCDRDCDNYNGRRLLLSNDEREFIFGTTGSSDCDISKLSPGLLSKLITAFMGESDESPYRFWLASCIEAYLRGSSNKEQVFVANTGLMKHLIDDITSQRLFCSGSLQTSFDLLGELCKGNLDVLSLLVKDLDETRFQKLMSVAAANLVDSNVFIRSLILGVERASAANNLVPPHVGDDFLYGVSPAKWKSTYGSFSRSYLTHSWWDATRIDIDGTIWPPEASDGENFSDTTRPSDWFPNSSLLHAYNMASSARPTPTETNVPSSRTSHFGWVFTPDGEKLSPATHAPNTVERLSWFLVTNQTRLLRDLLGVVDLKNINHENICCLNTAVVIAIFAHRRRRLHVLLEDLRTMTDEEHHRHRVLNGDNPSKDDVIDQSFVDAMKDMDVNEGTRQHTPFGRRASVGRQNGSNEHPDGRDVLQNFREVLWFWIEYYTHRGRDRLSLEFSSHLRFSEWMEVVSLLSADNGTPTSLMKRPLPLPRSPYFQRAS